MGRGEFRGRGRLPSPAAGRPESGRGNLRHSVRGRGSSGSRHMPRGRGGQASRAADVEREIYSRADGAIGDTNDIFSAELAGDRHEQRPMSFAKLKSLTLKENDPDGVLMELLQSRSGFVQLVNQNFGYKDNPSFIMCVMNIATRSSNPTSVRQLLDKLQGKLLLELNAILGKILMKDDSARCFWNNGNVLSKFIHDVSDFVQSLMSILPSTLAMCNGIILSLKSCASTFPNIDIQSCVQNTDEVFVKVKSEKETKEKVQLSMKRPLYAGNENAAPPDDFREIDIFPRMEDIHLNEAPFLRANKTKGKYDSVDTYLDVQFRLLREDYVQPLRQGIYEYRKAVSEGASVKRLRNIRVYQDVQILRPVCSSTGVNYILQFDCSQFKHINWTASRRLLYGSLVCLSSDNFDTAIYATVSERNPKHLVQGMIEVHFECLNGGVLDSLRGDTFIMAETSAYFEAYRHVLEGLQEITNEMPLKRYVVECETKVKPPGYLLGQGGPQYDLKTIKKSQKTPALAPVLNTNAWPDVALLDMDPSQYKALQTAITKELAIIQGPPGTGKTYVGLKVARLLLDNSQFWNTETDTSPILVVCFTNHALDQFLEGIHQYCRENKIVRIGGRCKNENLQRFTLHNVKKDLRNNRSRSFKLMQNERDCRKSLRENEEKINLISNKIRKTTQDIIPLEKLQHYMTPYQVKIISMHAVGSAENSMMSWLSFAPEVVPRGEMDDHSAIRLIKHLWADFILCEVEPLIDSELMTITNIRNTDLARRAEIYKTWLQEYQQHPAADVRSNSGILPAEELHSKVSRPFVKTQLGALINSKPGIYGWLHLDPNTDVKELKEVMETYHLGWQGQMKNADLDDYDDDLEESRALDDDDDDFDDLHLFEDRPKNQKKMKDETMQQWIVKIHQRKNAKKVRKILARSRPLSDVEAKNVTKLHSVPLEEKYNLYAYWLKKYREDLKTDVKRYEDEYCNAIKLLKEVRDTETAEILKNSVVMGMTTTGAAKYRNILQKVQPQIIIVEEAAEVLESHIITTLNKNCKHLILIGDHKQLRPSTTVYELSKKYQMDISLFERMVRNGFPCVTLEEQHRMRPEISRLLRSHRLYENLRDHKDVFKYPNVKGVDCNIQFIDHEEGEESVTDSTSYTNMHEAKYISELCRYFINQGYAKEQITVLTPYMGQVTLLRKEMPKAVFEGVRITPVDNFQGEENDIILLSLVRSSEQGKSTRRNPIGFVGIENRICVALSRAKIGMYVLGNFKLFESHSEMWQEILAVMREHKLVNSSLLLRCSNHPKQVTYAKSASDFAKVPEGGCMEPCGAHLSCGHICPRSCHAYDLDHKEFTCMKPCKRFPPKCPDQHPCTKKCHQDCGKCMTKVERKTPICGHDAKMPCHMDPFKWECKETCTAVLSCGHKCKKRCHDCKSSKQHETQCKEKVERKLPCGHTHKMPCHQNVSDFQCPTLCTQLHDCGHECSGTCGQCFGGKIHEKCKGSCGKVLPCGHKCTYPCSDVCPPCSQKCQWKCSHRTKCKKVCSEACTPCKENCYYRCDHVKCDKECHEMCPDNVACNQKCGKRLKCGEGHVCSSLCGEKCICLQCSEKHLRNDIGQEFTKDDVFMQLPDCNCIFEVGRLDKHMKGKPMTLRGKISKVCPFPTCSKLIATDIRRYSNELKKTREEIVKHFDTLRGQEMKRKSKIGVLSKHIDALAHLLTKEELHQLSRPLKTDVFGGIHITERKVEIMNLLLLNKTQVTLETSVFLAENGILHPDVIKSVICKEKKFVTSQYFDELKREISRTSCGRALGRLEPAVQRNGNKEAEKVFQLSTQLVREVNFDESKRTCVKGAVEILSQFCNGTTDEYDLLVTLARLNAVVKNSDERKRTSNKNLTPKITSPSPVASTLNADLCKTSPRQETSSSQEESGGIETVEKFETEV